MTLSSFLKLVEIQTKVASMIPFSLGSIYALYHFNTFNLKNFALMFVSLLAFDMATTAINNYNDYKKAAKTHGYGYEEHNAIVRDGLTERMVLATIFTLLGIATVFGFLLFLNTSVIVLLLGAVSFMVGVLYSYGPVPISRMPLGELFSGLFMGFVIVFVSTFIHVYDQNIVTLMLKNGMLSFSVNILEVLYIFLISIPAVVGIANIMLANNICDIEEDIENKRYTLPIYIGRDNALKLFKALYYGGYISIVMALILKIQPIISILTLITLIPINKNIEGFFNEQTKKNTFVLAVKNFVLMNVAQICTIGLATGIYYTMVK